MADVDLNLVMDRLDKVIREQTEARALARDFNSGFLTIMTKIDRLTDEVTELRGEIVAFKIQLRALADRIGDTVPTP
jgi:flagellin-like hook-associated protein FlgL